MWKLCKIFIPAHYGLIKVFVFYFYFWEPVIYFVLLTPKLGWTSTFLTCVKGMVWMYLNLNCRHKDTIWMICKWKSKVIQGLWTKSPLEWILECLQFGLRTLKGWFEKFCKWNRKCFSFQKKIFCLPVSFFPTYDLKVTGIGGRDHPKMSWPQLWRMSVVLGDLQDLIPKIGRPGEVTWSLPCLQPPSHLDERSSNGGSSLSASKSKRTGSR